MRAVCLRRETRNSRFCLKRLQVRALIRYSMQQTLHRCCPFMLINSIDYGVTFYLVVPSFGPRIFLLFVFARPRLWPRYLLAICYYTGGCGWPKQALERMSAMVTLSGTIRRVRRASSRNRGRVGSGSRGVRLWQREKKTQAVVVITLILRFILTDARALSDNPACVVTHAKVRRNFLLNF